MSFSEEENIFTKENLKACQSTLGKESKAEGGPLSFWNSAVHFTDKKSAVEMLVTVFSSVTVGYTDIQQNMCFGFSQCVNVHAYGHS